MMRQKTSSGGLFTGQEEYFKRSKRAQLIHTVIMDYIIRYPNSTHDIEGIKGLLLNSSPSSLSAISSNGFSHLHDIARFSYNKHKDDPKLADEIFGKLFQIVISVCKKRKLDNVLANLLISKNDKGKTILNDVLVNCSEENVRLFLNELQELMIDKKTSIADFNQYVVGAAIGENKYTHLCIAIKTGKPEIVRLYLDFLKEAYHRQHIHPGEYFINLIGLPGSRVSPLHLAATSGKFEIVKMIVEELERLFANITPNPIPGFLTAIGHAREKPWCRKEGPEKDKINDYLELKLFIYTEKYEAELKEYNKRPRVERVIPTKDDTPRKKPATEPDYERKRRF